MPRSSSLTQEQRRAAVTLFEAGCGRDSAAAQLGVRPTVLRALYDRWRVWGVAVLTPQPSPRRYAFALKWEILQRYEAGAAKVELAQEYGLSAPSLIETWLRAYRKDGIAGLQPKPRGRPIRDPQEPASPESELAQLRRENERLRAEVAYLGKLRALGATERR